MEACQASQNEVGGVKILGFYFFLPLFLFFHSDTSFSRDYFSGRAPASSLNRSRLAI